MRRRFIRPSAAIRGGNALLCAAASLLLALLLLCAAAFLPLPPLPSGALCDHPWSVHCHPERTCDEAAASCPLGRNCQRVFV